MRKPKSKWLCSGLFYGILMYVFMVILYPLIIGEALTKEGLLVGIPVWIAAGLLFGFMMKRIKRKKSIKAQS